jgi:CheY-like chemotaxis protein
VNILIGDDDENDAMLLLMALRKAGVVGPVPVIREGKGILRYLQGSDGYSDRKRYPEPDLVILDLKMPWMTGLEVLQMLQTRPEAAKVTIIVLSGTTRPEDVKLAYKYGAKAFFTKPGDIRELEQLVHIIYQHWLRAERPGTKDRAATEALPG